MFESKKTIQMWADLGDDSYYGLNGEKVDYELASDFYFKASQKKHPHATFMYGLCCELGHGVEKDMEYAEILYENAAKYGDPDAKKRMQTGKLYEPSAPKGEDDDIDDEVDSVQDDADEIDEIAQAVLHYTKKKYKQAFPLLEKAAENGNSEAQYYLGLMYENGRGVEADMGKSVEWLKKSAARGNKDAAEYLESMADYEAATEEHEKAVRQVMKTGEEIKRVKKTYTAQEKELEALIKNAEKSATAAYDLGLKYEKGDGIEADQKEAYYWYSQAAGAESGIVPQAVIALAYMYYEGRGTARDRKEAYRLFKLSNSQVDVFNKAYYMMGVMERDGDGAPKDLNAALGSFGLAVKYGHTEAEKARQEVVAQIEREAREAREAAQIASEYMKKSERDKAIPYLKKAADLGDTWAQLALGVLYEDGAGITQDNKSALYWYEKAGHKGDVRAQRFIGAMYHNGKGAGKNYEKAIYWCEKAAKQGDVVSMNRLGLLYVHAENEAQRDRNKAAYWYIQSKKQGNQNGVVLLANLVEYLESMSALGESWARENLEQIKKIDGYS